MPELKETRIAMDAMQCERVTRKLFSRKFGSEEVRVLLGDGGLCVVASTGRHQPNDKVLPFLEQLRDSDTTHSSVITHQGLRFDSVNVLSDALNHMAKTNGLSVAEMLQQGGRRLA